MGILVTPKIRAKLANKPHPVDVGEIEECFATRERAFLKDTREQHLTNPPTMWFISDTFRGRFLKIVFIQRGDVIHIKSAFEPNAEEKRIYFKHATEI